MTSTTMVTTLDLVTPTSEEQPGPAPESSDFSTVVLSPDGSELVTQSAPNTPIQHREQANAEFGQKEGSPDPKNMVAATGNASKPSLNSFYADGLGQLRNGLFSCFQPVFGYFGTKTTVEIEKSEDELWEIPFDAISELEWLGSGSQGAVFRGQLENRTVAVKKVNQLKETEIKHLRHLRHQNIIEFLGVCSKSPCYCIVMEYCSKGQLCTVLKSRNTITRELFAQWVKEIADGMHYLHQNKVIHRDLKSPNILISAEDSIKICDFGTSHMQKKMDSTMMSFCGTVSWMAPEMIKKQPCNEKVDVYSFGVVLWEMLTRETPYANIAQMAIIFGVGTNILSLPMPEEAPKGLVLLIKQCLSQKGRNRPSFSHIRQHWEIFKPELFEMTEEEWQLAWDSYREFAKCIQYPSTVTRDHGGPKSAFAMEEEIQRKRHEQLNHIKDIRNMYEMKLKRTNKMYDKLQGCFTELKLKESELAEWEKDLTEREQWHNQNSPKAVAAPRAQLRGYPNEGYDDMSSDEDVQPCRGSPYRCSNTSSSSGVQSSPFSRQSSSRSSAGQQTRRSEGANPPKILRNDAIRHSGSYWETLGGARGSPARDSGFSQDSGMWSAGAGSCTAINGGGQQVCYSQTLYRNGDGRWSDGRIASRRRVSTSVNKSTAVPGQPVFFTRDSPSRVPHARSSSKLNRSSYPSRNAPHQLEDGCCCAHARAPRAKSIAVPMTSSSRARSPTPYDNDFENAESFVDPESPKNLKNLEKIVNLPESTSYDEALCNSDVTMNPIYTSPITTYSNPCHVELVDEENANDVDLTSSMDSRRSRSDDADVESSEEDEGNGNNILNTSMESEDLRYRIDTSQSTMMSSLERSLEIGATRSDGLSDNEMRVQAVKMSIKTHRRTGSNPQALIHQCIDEYTTSATDDSDDAGAVRI
ncbi:Mitogen-activated protein kinase kinase kinase dlk-1 [Caenorhabditis elegans]|uniref:Isoform b of Mitogen-activated protein kinase kinase kinase dlk-1 n=1 Tax=Caenorhabditis elegans TaxID=6239 RepID=O01700-2|nr:Mitogen-activated protein kinase kinase kinase dlk-1 [Caenorhabditis elegans]CAE54891.1 Mitogen-activated protein kinase kinase kinase dlk-1 [Caenorhabditis elegans]|eukprot:NP_001021444.1 Mitogen-activated protein kinase kinase kinase dlk-1 [Caenorhabditis elegans]